MGRVRKTRRRRDGNVYNVNDVARRAKDPQAPQRRRRRRISTNQYIPGRVAENLMRIRPGAGSENNPMNAGR
jgi:hypothetical protein